MSEATEVRALLAEIRELLAASSDAETLARAAASRRFVEVCDEVVQADEGRATLVLLAMPLGRAELDLTPIGPAMREIRESRIVGSGVSLHLDVGAVRGELLTWRDEEQPITFELSDHGCMAFRATLGKKQGHQLLLLAEDFSELCRALASGLVWNPGSSTP